MSRARSSTGSRGAAVAGRSGGVTLLLVIVLAAGLGACAFDAGTSDESAYYGSAGSETQNNVFLGTSVVDFTIGGTGSEVSFSWNDNGRPYVFLVIFDEDIDVAANRIDNVEDAVWVWHSGLGKGLRGDIDYADGVSVSDGAFDPWRGDLATLADGTYQAALWMYDANYNLSESSVLQEFTLPQ